MACHLAPASGLDWRQERSLLKQGDQGYGDAWAKTWVYAAGNLVLEREEVRVTMGDL